MCSVICKLAFFFLLMTYLVLQSEGSFSGVGVSVHDYRSEGQDAMIHRMPSTQNAHFLSSR